MRAAQFNNLAICRFLRQCQREIVVNRRVVHLKAPKRMEKRAFANTLPKMEIPGRQSNVGILGKETHVSLFKELQRYDFCRRVPNFGNLFRNARFLLGLSTFVLETPACASFLQCARHVAESYVLPGAGVLEILTAGILVFIVECAVDPF